MFCSGYSVVGGSMMGGSMVGGSMADVPWWVVPWWVNGSWPCPRAPVLLSSAHTHSLRPGLSRRRPWHRWAAGGAGWQAGGRALLRPEAVVVLWGKAERGSAALTHSESHIALPCWAGQCQNNERKTRSDNSWPRQGRAR